jgi:hypothetical protein
MPAILTREEQTTWLLGSVDGARAMLKPYAANLMDAYEVSTPMNSPKDNSPSNITPMTSSTNSASLVIYAERRQEGLWCSCRQKSEPSRRSAPRSLSRDTA